MAYGRPANIRSHRRGNRRAPRRSASWIRVALISAVSLAVLAAGYQLVLAQTCSGEETARVLAAPATARLLGEFAADWANDEPSTDDGACARVIVESRDSVEVAAALAAGWDPAVEPPPDVWVPESTAWAARAAAAELAAPLMPQQRPSIARTPAVIAMPAPMAAELDWPDTRLRSGSPVRWESLPDLFADDRRGWARFGHPEWGAFRFGMSDPARDTAGLLALTAILDTDQTGDTSAAELAGASRLHRLLDGEVYHESTEELLGGLATSDAEGAEAALRHVSAFPALEQDVLAYNRADPEVPLVAVYPAGGTIEADHPYLVLNAGWVSGPRRAVAEAFLAYLGTEGPQRAFRDAGFRRASDGQPGADISEQNGLVPELAALPRPQLVPESVARAVEQWAALGPPGR